MIPDPAAQARDLVKRDLRPAAPDRPWFADITYVRTNEGWLYLAAILDAYSRLAIGRALANHPRTELALAALRMALAARRPAAGLIHHTDRGCQYTANNYAWLLTRNGVAQSLGRPGTCFDSENGDGWRFVSV
jgi:putative transposase